MTTSISSKAIEILRNMSELQKIEKNKVIEYQPRNKCF